MRQVLISILLIAAVTVVTSRRQRFNDRNMPIRIVDTSHGQGNRERVDYIEAEILPRHLRNSARVNFPRSGPIERHFQGVRAPGDERGHLVASQFSGPPQLYNLSPQNARVNRNAGYQSITTDWYGAECEVRRFLQQGGNRRVHWRVRMRYIRDSNRPDSYHLMVRFINNGRDAGPGIDTTIHNPFLRQDSTFWVCKQCRKNKHIHDDLRRRSIIEGGCHKV